MELENQSKKSLLLIHFIFIIIWVGGVISCLPLFFHLDAGDYRASLYTYLHIKEIANNVIVWGGIGTFVTGVFLAFSSSWGIWKHKWVRAKLIFTIAIIAFGILFIENRLLINIEQLKSQANSAFQSTDFLTNYVTLKIGLISICIVFLFNLYIAIFKPWMRKDTSWRYTGKK